MQQVRSRSRAHPGAVLCFNGLATLYCRQSGCLHASVFVVVAAPGRVVPTNTARSAVLMGYRKIIGIVNDVSQQQTNVLPALYCSGL